MPDPKLDKVNCRPLLIVIAAAALYTSVSFCFSVLQYEALNVPHGDTGMYEEHLWNLAHGKGFRSQLDDGRLFFGEHFECIHVLLLPAYLVYPSLVTLYLFESAALASGSVAIYLLARRLGIAQAALPLGLAWLLYPPLQYLDFELTWKNFRPESFGVPLTLFSLLAFEGQRYKTGILLVALSFLAKEDYGVVGASIGMFLFARSWLPGRLWKETFVGLGLAAGSAAYLFLVLLWIIPHFRGDEAHYTSYFEGLGASPREIVVRIFSEPRIVSDRLFTRNNGSFLIQLLTPLAYLPLLSPLRLAVCMPTLFYLMMSDRPELAQPWFHFHGPLVPILFWATAGGIRNVRRVLSPAWSGGVVLVLCAAMGFLHGRGPLSWAFYRADQAVPRSLPANPTIRDDGRVPIFEPMGAYWRDLYLPSERSKAFARAAEHIRSTDRVAATDYVRGRFTHCAAAHDYPRLRANVTIDDIDVIVLDKTEGWWGRGETNPDRELLDAMNRNRPPGTQISVRGKTFVVVYHDPYFLVVRGDSEDRKMEEHEGT